jgi:hypothetical protein
MPVPGHRLELHDKLRVEQAARKRLTVRSRSTSPRLAQKCGAGVIRLLRLLLFVLAWAGIRFEPGANGGCQPYLLRIVCG